MNELEKLMQAARRGTADEVQALIEHHPEIINRRDESGATALHYAAFGGHCDVVRLLIRNGAEVNAHDGKFGATPTGWAIEYLRELGGFLGIELDDFAYAVRRGDLDWVARFLQRFPALRSAADKDGTPFQSLAAQSGNPDIERLFQTENGG